MIFDYVGTNGNPVIIMLNGSFCTGNGLMHIAKEFSDRYYVILPTYDGHSNNSGIFTTRQDQAHKILQYLHSEHITEIALIHGLSMGAEIAFELIFQICSEKKINVRHCYFDGGPFFHFSVPLRLIMQRKFLNVIHMCSKSSPDETAKSLMNNKMVKWLVKGETEPYYNMLYDMCSAAPFMSNQSVKNESDACYTFNYPYIDEEYQNRFLFSFSTNEPARSSAKKMSAIYPKAVFKDVGALGHAGFAAKKPQEYAAFIRNIIER